MKAFQYLVILGCLATLGLTTPSGKKLLSFPTLVSILKAKNATRPLSAPSPTHEKHPPQQQVKIYKHYCNSVHVPVLFHKIYIHLDPCSCTGNATNGHHGSTNCISRTCSSSARNGTSGVPSILYCLQTRPHLCSRFQRDQFSDHQTL